ncbi:MAG TPA: cation transporter [Clostridiaceae bacterium]|jgi:cation diffusion facilitator family transporter|nr:cation transporter [Clostridiaceae bacterium]HBF77521.1 cation transporter [Clostridiaceae bacterium]HBG39161.1 cation transporter [Clostridiaceae bacterium]HBN29500.1 cation transporter [Clostridiaceae bacterium]HBX47829.1 cation transporter [Clostridiaceae bacterium]
MLAQWLVKKTANDSVKNKRQKIGYLGGIVGIVVNSILFASKLAIGMFLNSVSILADAFNNLSDLGSCLVTIIGFKIADKPADKDHPFGHGRGEYIAGLIVSFMVILVGLEFTKTSINRITNPVKIEFSLISFIILIISIIAKAWLGYFNKYLSKEISSGTLNANSFDSFADVITTSCVASSLVISKYTDIPIDGYIGLLVSIFVLYEGYSLIKETISPLLGEAPEPELVKSIVNAVMSYENIIGVHDLIIHSYGTGKYMATIHAEVPSSIPVMDAHEIIDKAEREISEKFDIILVIHMDPINIDDEEINKTRIKIEEILKSFPAVRSIHDFRIVGKEPNKNILFDIVVSRDVSHDDLPSLVAEIKNTVHKKYPSYNLVIECDRDYTI